MAVDPNIYALQIQLALDAASAFQTLSDFGDKVVDIETQITNAGKKAVGSVQGTIDGISSSLGKATGQLKTMGKTGNKQLDFWQEVYDQNKELEKFGESEIDRVDELLGQFDKIQKALTKKNQKHEDELDFVTSEIPLLGEIGKGLSGNSDKVAESAVNTYNLYDAMRQILGILTEIDSETENFVTTNYRAYGSQQDLVQATRELSAESGIMRDKALEAYKVLGNLRVPKDELRQYAKVVSMATRFTGVGIPILANYAQGMRQIGQNAAQLERHITFTAEVMRKFGLGTDDASKALGQTSLSARELESIFRGTDQADKFNKLRLVVAGLGKQAGYTAEQAEELMAVFQDPILLSRFEDQAGMAINSVEDLTKAMVTGGKSISDQWDEIDRAVESGAMNVQESKQQYQQLADVYFGGSTAARDMAIAVYKQNKALGLNLENTTDLEKAVGMAMDMIKQKAEADATLTMQLMLLKDRVVSLISYALQPLADVLKEAIKYLNWMLDGIIWLGNEIYKYYVILKTAFPWVEKFVTYLKYGAAAVIALGVALVSLGVIFGLIPGVIRFVSMGIVGLFKAIGDGLLALGNAVKSVMVPLIALGAAFMLTGIGAYFFAESVKIIAELGWSAVPAMFGMILAIGVLGLVLVGLSALIQGPVAIGMVILAGTFLAIGAAAMMSGYGMKMFAEGLVNIYENALPMLAYLPALAGGLVLLGAAALIAAPGLLAMAVAAWLLAPAAVLLGGGLLMLSTAIKSLDYDSVTGAAWALATASAIFMAAAVVLLPASVMLVAAGVLLGVASAALLVVSFGVVAAGIALGVGAAAMLVSSGIMLTAGLALVAASSMILASGVMLGIGGGLILAGAVAFGAGVALLVVASAGAWAASVALASAALFLTPAVAAISTVGLLLQVSGTALKDGASNLVSAVARIAAAADLMNTASGSIGYLGIALGRLAVGATFLLPASLAIYAGLGWIGLAVTRLSVIAPKIGDVAENLDLLARSISSLGGSDMLSQFADNALAAVPLLDKFATSFESISDRLRNIAGNVVGTINDIASATSELNSYAMQVEAATARVDAALRSQAIPAMLQTDQNPESDARSDAISTVQIMNNKEGESESSDSFMEIVSVLRQLLEHSQSSDAENKELLQSIQSAIIGNSNNEASIGSDLDSDMTAWGR